MNLNLFLEAMGESPYQVACWLRQHGIKGKRESKNYCPILNAIYDETIPEHPPAWPGLLICNGRNDGTRWHYCATYHDGQIMDPVLPQPVMDFIGEFDRGSYPDLEAATVVEKTVRTWS